MSHILILCILLILLVLLYLYKHQNQYYEGFENSKSLVICTMKGCGHCEKAKGEFDKLLGESPISIGDNKINVKILDAQKDKDEILKYNVQGYPTILLDNEGSVMEYNGNRTYDGIMEFLKKSLQ